MVVESLLVQIALLWNIQTSSVVHIASSLMGTKVLLWLAYEVDHSPPWSAEVKMNSAPPVCFHGMDKDKSTFPFTFYI
jgi:hypothetical protein